MPFKLRVIGGPIRRPDRVIVEVTGNMTFQAMLPMIHKQVEELDLADLCEEDFHDVRSAPVSPGQQPLPHVEVPQDGTNSSGAFATPQGSSDDELTARSDDSLESKEEGDQHKKKEKKIKKQVVPGGIKYEMPAAFAAALQQQQQQNATAAPAGAAAARTQQTVRLSKYPIDEEHYEIAQFDLELTEEQKKSGVPPASSKARATKILRPYETPKSTKLAIPAICLILKKKYADAQEREEMQKVTQSATLLGSQLGATSAPQRSPDASAPISGLGNMFKAMSDDPLNNNSFHPPSDAAAVHLASFTSVDGNGLGGGGGSLSRGGSFSRHPGLAHDRHMERLAAAYRIQKHDHVQLTLLHRMLAKAGRNCDAVVDLAHDTLKDVFAAMRDKKAAAGSAPSVVKKVSVASTTPDSAPLGVTFAVAEHQQFLKKAVMLLDKSLRDAEADLLVDMVVQTAPVGELKSFIATYLLAHMADTESRSKKKKWITTALRGFPAETLQDTRTCERLELMQRESIARQSVTRLADLTIASELRRWSLGHYLLMDADHTPEFDISSFDQYGSPSVAMSAIRRHVGFVAMRADECLTGSNGHVSERSPYDGAHLRSPWDENGLLTSFSGDLPRSKVRGSSTGVVHHARHVDPLDLALKERTPELSRHVASKSSAMAPQLPKARPCLTSPPLPPTASDKGSEPRGSLDLPPAVSPSEPNEMCHLSARVGMLESRVVELQELVKEQTAMIKQLLLRRE